jgi:2-dehydro-3-deoxyphosphogluconate aldolase / (4S)-4-hydroxy-2-oxoglutarate aldolase
MNAPPSAEAILAGIPVIPVVVLEDASLAVPLAEALVAGGLPVIELTLRTKAALESIREIATRVPAATVGAGSVLDATQMQAAIAAGARFTVSPGATSALIQAARAAAVPWIPGVQTASEALELRDHGYRLLKFFPAESSGGAEYLRALQGPVPDLRFCPTGGIDLARAPSYLALANVACIGGSWLTPATLIGARDWAGVAARARQAAALRASH